TRLPFLPITAPDSLGWPWGSILARSDGGPGFISTPKWATPSFTSKVWNLHRLCKRFWRR
ncbi:hypothetical protein ARMGADRAFT_942572, partial [Armillaria gallica]